FLIAASKRQPMFERAEARRRLTRRRMKAVRLIEELQLRTQCLELLFDKLKEIATRVEWLCAQLDEMGDKARRTPQARLMREERRRLTLAALQMPGDLSR